MNVFLIDRADDGPIGGDRYFFIFAIKKYSRVTCEKYSFIYIYASKSDTSIIAVTLHPHAINFRLLQFPLHSVSFPMYYYLHYLESLRLIP